jgi:3'-phosphoadenosine 5'-phosphosulfate sulfotransferase (PAPS reductase)/FAD synthetase
VFFGLTGLMNAPMMKESKLHGPAQSALWNFAGALAEHDPRHVYCLFSGGDDSIVTTHLIRQVYPAATVAHIDTGTGFPEVRRHVVETCRRYGWPLRIIGHEQHRGKTFEQWTKENGMPGPSGHSFVYEHLKQRAIEQLRREAKEGWWDRVLFVTGVYASESTRRAEIHSTVTHRKGATVMNNPCLHWDDMDFARYRRQMSLPRNPVSEVVGKSGECLCGAYSSKGELDRIRLVSPDVADWIEQVEEEAKGRWGYEDDGPTKTEKMEEAGQLSMPLCTDCKV